MPQLTYRSFGAVIKYGVKFWVNMGILEQVECPQG
jgi:hypothetical protein